MKKITIKTFYLGRGVLAIILALSALFGLPVGGAMFMIALMFLASWVSITSFESTTEVKIREGIEILVYFLAFGYSWYQINAFLEITVQSTPVLFLAIGVLSALANLADSIIWVMNFLAKEGPRAT